MKFIISIVSFYSNNYIFETIESIFKYVKVDKILVIDNNPQKGENVFVEQNSKHYKWSKLCDLERNKLLKQENIIYYKNDHLDKSHGFALDLIKKWCGENNYTHFLHVEPDVQISSNKWFVNLIQNSDYSLVGTTCTLAGKTDFGPIHVCPSLWKISDIHYSFKWQVKSDELKEPQYSFLCPGLDNYPFFKENWDTGHKNWYELAKQNKTKIVNGDGLIHLWHGTNMSFQGKLI